MKHVSKLTGERLPLETGRLPFITLHAFCDTAEAQEALERVAQDRRMSRVQASVHPGGLRAAINLYETSPTPNLVILESHAAGSELLAELDALAAVCDSGTKVLIVGYSNDIALYRALIQKGVSDYVVGPVDTVSLIARIADLYLEASTAKLSRSIAFVGVKGGVGSSTIAQNVASAIARQAQANTILVDLDLAFGSSSLNLDLEDRQGVLGAVQDAGRLDEVLLERLMVNYENNLNVLAAPATLEQTYDFDSKAFDRLLDVAQATMPYVVLDVPHLWSGWSRNVLISADEVVVTATPDLVSLRNAKQLVEWLKRTRSNDGPPRLLLNQVGVPKRKEIKPKEFADAVGLEAIASIPFEPATFSNSAINGKMIADASAKSAACAAFRETAQLVIGRCVKAPRARYDLRNLFKGKPKLVRP